MPASVIAEGPRDIEGTAVLASHVDVC